MDGPAPAFLELPRAGQPERLHGAAAGG
jgi:hypothetical protein